MPALTTKSGQGGQLVPLNAISNYNVQSPNETRQQMVRVGTLQINFEIETSTSSSAQCHNSWPLRQVQKPQNVQCINMTESVQPV